MIASPLNARLKKSTILVSHANTIGGVSTLSLLQRRFKDTFNLYFGANSIRGICADNTHPQLLGRGELDGPFTSIELKKTGSSHQLS